MSRRSLSVPDTKKLWSASAGLCNMCKVQLAEKKGTGRIVIGEHAHIAGAEDGSARYDSNMSDDQINAYENYILLCPTDHTRIDNDESSSDFPIEKLKQIKQEHELWVENRVRSKVQDLTFQELQTVIDYIENAPIQEISDDLSLLALKDKILKNSFSASTERQIQMGLTQVSVIKDFFNRYPDPHFIDTVRGKFLAHYKKIYDLGYRGDEIFYEMLDFATSKSNPGNVQSAALCIIVYLFEQCDIFEK